MRWRQGSRNWTSIYARCRRWRSIRRSACRSCSVAGQETHPAIAGTSRPPWCRRRWTAEPDNISDSRSHPEFRCRERPCSNWVRRAPVQSSMSKMSRASCRSRRCRWSGRCSSAIPISPPPADWELSADAAIASREDCRHAAAACNAGAVDPVRRFQRRTVEQRSRGDQGGVALFLFERPGDFRRGAMAGRRSISSARPSRWT